MNEQARQQLDTLRSAILEEMLPLAKGDAFDPQQKFVLMLNVARGSGKPEAFKLAFEAAHAMGASEDKANALLDLLEEIDVQLGEISAEPGQTQES